MTSTLMLTTSDRWAAVARHGNLTIVAAGHQVEPASLQLKPITDPLAQLLGTKPPDA